MREQLNLLAWAPPAVKRSATSRAAAVSIKASVKGLRLAVLSAVRDLHAHGATSDEIEVVLDMRHQTASARLNELAKAGLIVDSGRTRATRSGRKAVVYVAREVLDASTSTG